jgi:hypothetical protein
MRAEYVIDALDEQTKITLKRTPEVHVLEIKTVGQEDSLVYVKLRDLIDAVGGLAGEWWAEFKQTAEGYLNDVDDPGNMDDWNDQQELNLGGAGLDE